MPARTMGVDPAWTVNEVLRRYPAAVAVFNAFGVDACCGGANGVPEAAREAGLDPADLLAALESAVCPADAGAPAGR